MAGMADGVTTLVGLTIALGVAIWVGLTTGEATLLGLTAAVGVAILDGLVTGLTAFDGEGPGVTLGMLTAFSVSGSLVVNSFGLAPSCFVF